MSARKNCSAIQRLQKQLPTAIRIQADYFEVTLFVGFCAYLG